MRLFSTKQALAGAAQAWPKGPLLDILRASYASVEHLQDDNGLSLYGVTADETRFVVAFVTVDGAPDMISEVGFLARFTGFQPTLAAIEEINRNLRISVATLDNSGDVFLIGGRLATGDYEREFPDALTRWRFDLDQTVSSLLGGTALRGFAPAQSAIVCRFAENKAPTFDAGADLQTVLRSAFGGDARAKAVCGVCDGRGKVGLIARTCDACDGSGVVRKKRLD
ncbi:MAG: hypothetical protein ACFB00_06535 [Parvularculaceae bacterium]